MPVWQRRTSVWRKVTSPARGAKRLRNEFANEAIPVRLLPEGRFYRTMTLQEAKSIARYLGLTLRQARSGTYRLNFRDANEATAYYTDSLEDAVNIVAVEMARTRNVMRGVDEAMTTRPAPSRLKALSGDELWQLYDAHVWRPRDQQLDELGEAILAEIDRRAKLPPIAQSEAGAVVPDFFVGGKKRR
jgi:hypothetical protein